MRLITLKIPIHFRVFLFCALALSWITGVMFFVLNRWFEVEGTFGWEKHPWQYPALQIHGFAAFAMLMFSGALIANHVPSGWKANKLRASGLCLIGALCIQIISAYLLYYASNDHLRVLISNLHTFTGTILPALLIIHIIQRIRSR